MYAQDPRRSRLSVMPTWMSGIVMSFACNQQVKNQIALSRHDLLRTSVPSSVTKFSCPVASGLSADVGDQHSPRAGGGCASGGHPIHHDRHHGRAAQPDPAQARSQTRLPGSSCTKSRCLATKPSVTLTSTAWLSSQGTRTASHTPGCPGSHDAGGALTELWCPLRRTPPPDR